LCNYLEVRQRRDRLPIITTDYKVLALNSPNTNIEGIPARSNASAAGASTEVLTSFEAQEIYPYIAFDFLALDENNNGLRIDLTTSGGNYCRWYVNATNIKKGINHIILNKTINCTVTGTPDWVNMTSFKVRVTASSAGAHSYKVSQAYTYKRKGVVTLWFDDCHNTVYNTAKPAMDTYGFKGVQAVIGSYIGLNTSYQTATQLASMQAAGWEHCNHTYSHRKFGEITAKEAEISLQRGLDYCLGHNFGKASYYFVNPGGQSTAETLPIEKKYCTVRRIGVGYNLFPIVDMHNIKSQSPLWNTTVDTVKGWIDDAVVGGLWVVLLFHHIRPASYDGDTTMAYPSENFAEVLSYLDTKQTSEELKVLTCSEALSTM
jgi:peptidoglycan/xylan/chitin deacetylase (PgdA/CDA1 family)